MTIKAISSAISTVLAPVPRVRNVFLLSVELSKRTLDRNRQVTVIEQYFYNVLLEAQGGRLETNAVQRLISTVSAVSEGRSPHLNPFETKRKKGPTRAHHRFW